MLNHYQKMNRLRKKFCILERRKEFGDLFLKHLKNKNGRINEKKRKGIICMRRG